MAVSCVPQGILDLVPPFLRHGSTWNADNVTGFLRSPGRNWDLSLRDLTPKFVMILLLIHGSWLADISDQLKELNKTECVGNSSKWLQEHLEALECPVATTSSHPQSRADPLPSLVHFLESYLLSTAAVS